MPKTVVKIPSRSPKKKNLLVLGGILFLIIVLSASSYFYNKNSQNPKTDAQVQGLIAQVGKFYLLPTNETPTIATVSDKSKLSDQPFFRNAENGDKVLIYSTSKKAILYRPSINKIIEVAPVNLGQSLGNTSPSPQASPSAAPIIKLAIYNGTKNSGLARKQGEALETKYPNVEIIATSNAAEDYTESLVIDLLGKNADFVKTLAGELSGKVGNLPSEETKPSNADILIILGE